MSKARRFKISVVSHKKYRSLPYKHVDESLGLTDLNNAKIYVVNMGSRKLNRQILRHEMGEMLSSFSPHEAKDEPGVRYGWFKKLTGISTPKWIKQAGAHAGSWAPQAAAAVMSLFPPTAPFAPFVATAGGGIHAYQSDKSLASVGLGALKGYFGGKALSGVAGGLKAGVGGLTGEGGNWGAALAAGKEGLKTGMSEYGKTAIIPGVEFTAPGTWGAGKAADASKVGSELARGAGEEGLGTFGVEGLREAGAATITGEEGTMLSELGIGSAPEVTASTEVGKNWLQKLGSTIYGGIKTAGEATGIGMNAETMGKMLMAGSGAGMMMAEPPVPKYTPEDYIKKSRELMSKYDLGSLPTYAQETARELVEMPTSGPELEAKVNDEFARVDRDLEVSRKDRVEAIQRQYSAAGATGDTQMAEDVARINQYVDAEKAIARGETRARVIGQAYEVKSNALQTVMQTGQFDSKLAMELAQVVGYEDELNNAIDMADYASFQETMSSIFGFGMQSVMETVMRKQFPDQYSKQTA